ncbi:hypothetical protein At15955_44560 [Agrobacterium tumefaciens]|jgi:hypothetical protein|nr:hypothetical protein AGROH133_09355 [Agrobacterium tumefaciens]AHK04557.1 hypothetical protein X971_4713 [Agrobacterium tumefaciens LBA4213 (Ach5)]AKC10297.1 hypothetical protein Ach5_45240 [Agrobacterium tumefaciens]MDP9562706.1 hypothetical protein [Rhizobium nepotum]TWC78604.1 hypothetical protein FB593_111128 [Rhizobium sp. SJZ105]
MTVYPCVRIELADFHLSPLRNTAQHHYQILDEKIDIA